MVELLEGFLLLAKQYGLQATLLVFFIGRDVWRESRMSRVICDLQTEMREVILPMAVNTTKVLAENSKALEINTEALEEGKDALNDFRLLLQQAMQAT